MITLSELKQHLRIEADTEDAYLQSLINLANEKVLNDIGRELEGKSEIARHATRILAATMYENRAGVEESMTNTYNNLIRSLVNQFSV